MIPGFPSIVTRSAAVFAALILMVSACSDSTRPGDLEGPTDANPQLQAAAVVADIDIKPLACPNPLSPNSKGKLSVALLGTAAFDVSEVDASTLLLEGVAPLRITVEDVSAPAPGAGCECHIGAPDGFEDLSLKFPTPDIVAAIGNVGGGSEVVLTLTGTLLDGTPFEAADCVLVVGPPLRDNRKNREEDALQAAAVVASIDIKPLACPNPLSPNSKGKLSVALLGTDVFDVSEVDASTLLLEGVAPLRITVEDVSAPAPGAGCECHIGAPDGFDDLSLKFPTPDIVAAIGNVGGGSEVVLTLTGTLLDGTPFEAADCVLVVGPPAHVRLNIQTD